MTPENRETRGARRGYYSIVTVVQAQRFQRRDLSSSCLPIVSLIENATHQTRSRTHVSNAMYSA